MTLFDYDLVVLGNSPAARASVELAARYRARVAWLPENHISISAEQAWFGFHALREAVLGGALQVSDGQRGVSTELLLKAQQQAQIQGLRQHLGGWAELGVDVIAAPSHDAGSGQAEGLSEYQQPTAPVWQWERRGRHLGIRIASLHQSRQLLARAYLLAPSPKPRIPKLPGLESIASDTLHSWLTWPELPRTVTVIGREPRGAAFAQLLASLGCDVTLVSRQPHLGRSTPLESLLRAGGVRLVLGVETLALTSRGSAAQEVSELAPGGAVADRSMIQVTADDQRWETDRLVLAAGWMPCWEDEKTDGRTALVQTNAANDSAEMVWEMLGETLGASLAEGKARVNRQGRTHHHQVYAVGAALGRDGYGDMDVQLAKAATRRILFGCFSRGTEPLAADVVWTLPPLVQLGLTIDQARAKHGDRAQLLEALPQDNLRFHLADAVVGGVQLVVHRTSGKLLGATVTGKEATEWSGAIALALQQNCSVTALARMPIPSPSFAAMVQDAAQQWRWQRLSQRPRVEDLWERFFNWRRTGGI